MTMDINNIINRLNEKLERERNNSPYETHVTCSLRIGNYTFDCYMDDKNTKEVNVFNDKNYDREYPNVSEFLSKSILDWEDLEADPEESEWEHNGFRNECDYLRWRFGRW